MNLFAAPEQEGLRDLARMFEEGQSDLKAMIEADRVARKEGHGANQVTLSELKTEIRDIAAKFNDNGKPGIFTRLNSLEIKAKAGVWIAATVCAAVIAQFLR